VRSTSDEDAGEAHNDLTSAEWRMRQAQRRGAS
jgi:hypothetical protein